MTRVIEKELICSESSVNPHIPDPEAFNIVQLNKEILYETFNNLLDVIQNKYGIIVNFQNKKLIDDSRKEKSF